MGIDSALVNTRTREYLDVRGFHRFTQEEVRAAVFSKDSADALVIRYAKDPVSNAYREWLANTLVAFGARGAAHPEDIHLCNDYTYDSDVSWYDVIEHYQRVGSVHDFAPQ